MEEIVRLSGTVAGVNRVTLEDAVVLQHRIPKGTDVFFLANGPDYLSPGYPIDQADRSESSKATHGRQVGKWSGDAAAMSSFDPERWLVVDETGEKNFDATAGPLLGFGLGPRGCYGRRLAYLELRLLLVMILWNFELQKCPEKLSGYDRVDKLTSKPKQTFVKLAKVVHH
jgi:cytochrome P450